MILTVILNEAIDKRYAAAGAKTETETKTKAKTGEVNRVKECLREDAEYDTIY